MTGGEPVIVRGLLTGYRSHLLPKKSKSHKVDDPMRKC